MRELEDIFKKLVEEKLKEKEKILQEAEEKKKEVLKRLEEDADKKWRKWYEKEKEALLRKQKEEMFNVKLDSKKIILKEKEKIWEEVLSGVRDFLASHKEFLPKRELITKEGKEETRVDIEDFLHFLKEKYIARQEEFFL
jgi:V/A-type H+-transporting ATPase subunit E